MATTQSDVKVGAYFQTPARQIRKVVSLTNVGGKMKVYYVAKSANVKNRPFTQGFVHRSPKTLVAPMDAFLKECGRLLTDAELEKLRRDKVLLGDE